MSTAEKHEHAPSSGVDAAKSFVPARVASAVGEAVAALAAGACSQGVVIHTLLTQLQRHLDARLVCLHGMDDDGALRLLAHHGASEELVAVLSVLDPAQGRSLAGEAAATRELRRVEARAADASILGDMRAILASCDVKAVLAAPLVAAGRMTGVVTCGVGQEVVSVDEEQAVLAALASIFAWALDEARTQERLMGRIDELGRAQEVLRDTEERLDRTLDDAPIGMALVGLDGRFLRVNRALCEIVGYAREELERLRFQDITHPEDLEIDLEHAARLLRGQIERYQLPKRYIRKSGEIVDIMLSASMVRDSRGAPLHYISQIEDITEKRRTEERLRQSEALFRFLAENASDIVYQVSYKPSRRFEYVNPAALTVTGYPPEEWYADPRLGEKLMHVDDRQTYERFQENPTFPLVMRFHRKTGELAWVEIRGTCLRDDKGELVTMTGVARDVTEHRLAEQMREEWISIVAHELRQPLTAIISHATLLARTQEPTQKRRAENVLQCAVRLDRLVGDLLETARIESQQLELARLPTDLRALVQGTVERACLEGRCEIEVVGDTPPVLADPARIEQVLGNLLTNAIKYGSPDTPIRVVVEGTGEGARVSVHNRGSRISPDDMPRLFQRFHRLHKGPLRGVGLGLYVCRGIIEAHGGRIWVESDDEGTTFRFTLPRAGTT